MKILFFLEGPEWRGDALEKRPLGGTETALLGVARELFKKGCEVFVATNTKEQHTAHGVHFFPLAQIASSFSNVEWDVLISIRQWLPFAFPLKVRTRIYFSPDAYDQEWLTRALQVKMDLGEGEESFTALKPDDFMSCVDFIFCVGHWQANTFVNYLHFPQDKIVVTRNAIFPERYIDDQMTREKRILYSSTPYRGLAHLVRYFPHLRQKHENLQLDVCGGMGVYGYNVEQQDAVYSSLYDALKKCGAILHGALNQNELAKKMLRARVFTYPNTYPETFCISVLEAQAAGLPVVTSHRAALVERVEHGVDGFLVQGEPGDLSYDEAFLSYVSLLLDDEDLWREMSHRARTKALSQTYENLAGEWIHIFKNHHEKKETMFPSLKIVAREIAREKHQGKFARFEGDILRFLLQKGIAQYGF